MPRRAHPLPSRNQRIWAKDLSNRELDVLELMALGLTNEEIGQQLFISEETVKTHCKRIYERLGARNRAHAVWLGVVRGWLVTSLPGS